MQKGKPIVRASAEDVKAMLDRGESLTDWNRVRATSQQRADRLADEEEGSLPEGWQSTVEIGLPQRKQGVHIRLDVDILAWFKSVGPGYQTRINSVLRSFVQARRRGGKEEHGPRQGSP